MLNKLIKGGAWAFSGKLLTALSGLVVNALLARLLTPEEMGAYFLSLSLVSIVAVVAQLGLTQTITRLVAESIGIEKPSRARRSIVLTIRMFFLSGIGVVLFFIIGGFFWIADTLFQSEIIANVTGLIAAWAIILMFQGFLSETFRGFHDIRLATLFGGLVTSIISMSLCLILWFFQGYSDLNQIIILSLIAGVSSVLLSSLFLWKKFSKLPLSTDREISISEILNISWPMWITNVTFLVLLQADLWIMGLYLSPEEVAVYGAVVRTVSLVSLSLLIINAVVPPMISEMYARGEIKEMEKILRVVATFAGIPAFIALGILVFFWRNYFRFYIWFILPGWSYCASNFKYRSIV